MSPETAPTARQLGYLRALASRTATTFTSPTTRAQASHEIERLRALDAEPPERSGQTEPPYATEVREEELSGFGATRTWRSSARVTASPCSAGNTRRTVLARYEISSGGRVIEATRGPDDVTVRDLPASGEEDRYTVETLSRMEAERELPALVADYLRRARELDAVPMSARALQILTGGASDG